MTLLGVIFMKKAIFIRIFTVLIIGLVMLRAGGPVFSADAARQTKQDMLKMLHIIDWSISMADPNTEAERLAHLNDGMRVTVIGFSIVKHIVTGLGGQIQLKSGENAGPKVKIILPTEE